jgi:hypothetical protein
MYLCLTHPWPPAKAGQALPGGELFRIAFFPQPTAFRLLPFVFKLSPLQAMPGP